MITGWRDVVLADTKDHALIRRGERWYLAGPECLRPIAEPVMRVLFEEGVLEIGVRPHWFYRGYLVTLLQACAAARLTGLGLRLRKQLGRAA